MSTLVNEMYSGSLPLLGRTVIMTDAETINSENVVSILSEALFKHEKNRLEIDYLYRYYKGYHPILERTKDVRPEICNKVVENRANEIVSFKVGYLMGEPVQYVSRGELNEGVEILNNYVFSEDKASLDKELAEWFTICGTAYRMILPDPIGEEDECPFEIYTLDPRYSFVVYQNGLGNKPLMGVKYIVREDNNEKVYSVYTETEYFEIVNNSITKHSYHLLGGVPIIEYPANNARLGAFEPVLSLMDCLDSIQSNRMDGIEQFIQSFMLFKGVDIDLDDFKSLKDLGALKVPSDGDVSLLTSELNQGQTQTLVDDIYKAILEICGMPSQGDGSTGDSSNNGAVILKNGWQSAEARAKDTELNFKKAEKKFLKLAIYLCNSLRKLDLKLSQIEIRFTRRNYENISEKASVLIQLLSNDKVHPKLAFEHSGLFTDPDVAYKMSEDYYKEVQEKEQEELTSYINDATNQTKLDIETGDDGNTL